MMPITPTRTRCARRLRLWRPWVTTGGPGLCWARCLSWAPSRPPSTTTWVDLPCVSESRAWSPWARVRDPSTTAPVTRPRAVRARISRPGYRTPTLPMSCCANSWPPVTSCWLSPAETPGCGGSEIACWRTPDLRCLREGGAAGRHDFARGVAARHSVVHQVPGTPRLRPVHPRRRPYLAPHQAWHPHHGWGAHHCGLAAGLLRCPPFHPDTLDGQRDAGALPDDWPGSRGLPGRLHQDLQTAQSGVAHQTEAGRADPGGSGFRRTG